MVCGLRPASGRALCALSASVATAFDLSAVLGAEYRSALASGDLAVTTPVARAPVKLADQPEAAMALCVREDGARKLVLRDAGPLTDIATEAVLAR